MDAVRMSLAVMGALVVGSGACVWTSSKPYLAGEQGPPLVVVASEPAVGAEGVVTDPRIHFWFDGRVHPDSVHSQSLRLFAGFFTVLGSRRVDLLDCRITLTPHDELAALLSHRAVVEEVSGFGRGPLEEPVSLTFVTGDASGAPLPPAEPPTLEALVAEVFSPRCDVCHRGYWAEAGLDLSDPVLARQGLVMRPSLDRPGQTLVLPGRHASSYLMWKLLGLPGIAGEPMPPDGDWPTDRSCGTSDPELRRIAAWIDGLASDAASP